MTLTSLLILVIKRMEQSGSSNPEEFADERTEDAASGEHDADLVPAGQGPQ